MANRLRNSLSLSQDAASHMVKQPPALCSRSGVCTGSSALEEWLVIVALQLETQSAFMERPAWLRYGAGVLFVGIAFALRAGCDRYLGEAHPFPFFLGATAVAVWYGGLGPAIVALVMGYLAADWFFVSPRLAFSHWNSFSFFSLATYLITGLIIAV